MKKPKSAQHLQICVNEWCDSIMSKLTPVSHFLANAFVGQLFKTTMLKSDISKHFTQFTQFNLQSDISEKVIIPSYQLISQNYKKQCKRIVETKFI